MDRKRTLPKQLLGLGLILSACGGDDLPPIHERSESLILRSPSDLPVCKGTFAKMEAEVIHIQKMFGSAPEPVDYSWMPESHYSADEFPCDFQAFGCAASFSVYARTLASTHELVHSARSGSLPSVLEEGLATLLDVPMDADAGVMASRAILLEALEAGTWSLAPDINGLYERLAHFTSFLFAQYGQEKFLEFEANVRWDDYAYRPRSEWARGFEAVYGASFDEAWADYADYPDCPPAQFHLPLTQCAMLATGPVDARLVPEDTFTRTLECSDDEVVGPIVSYNRSMVRSASYVVDLHSHLAGTVEIAWTGQPSQADRAVLTNCGNCWDGSAAFLSGSELHTSSKLRAGRHALILYRDLDATGEFGIELHD